MTVADVVEALCASLPGSSPTSFRALTSAARTRMEVVVHFLGLLELYKQGLVDLDQTATFGELRVLWTGGLLEATPEQGEDREALEGLGWPEPASVSLADLDYRG